MDVKGLMTQIEGTIDSKLEAVNSKLGEVENKILAGGTESKQDKQADWEKTCETVKLMTRAHALGDYSAHAKLEKAGLSIAEDAAGGHLVPGEFSTEIFRLADEYGVARRDCFNVPMTQNTKDMPIGLTGVDLAYVGEGEVKSRVNPTFGVQTLVARTAAGIIQVTKDLLDDTPTQLAAYLTRVMGESVPKREDTSAFLGNGGTIPGIVGTAGVVSKVAGGTGMSDVDADDIHELVYGLSTAASRGAKLYMSRALVGHLSNIKDTDGHYLISKPTENRPMRLFGADIVESEAFSATPSAGDAVAVFGNLRNCYWGNRQQLAILPSDQASLAVYDGETLTDVVSAFQRNLRFIRFEIRHDFKPALASAFAVLRLAVS